MNSNQTHNKQLASKVIGMMPKHLNCNEYLMTKFGLSRESAYRRIRGVVLFSVDELSVIAREFGFSMDEVLGVTECVCKESNFLSLMQNYYNYIELIAGAHDPKIKLSMNRLDFFFLVENELLFKFYYYKWLHQAKETAYIPFSQTVVPAEIEAIRYKLVARIHQLKEIDFIVHKDLFLPLTQEIQYYHNLHLISEEEISQLKGELHDLLQTIASRMRQHLKETRPIYHVYLSLLEVEINSICTEFSTTFATLYWVSSSKVLIFNNRDTGREYRNHIEAMKKCSVLISQSNELLQEKFIEKQRQYIDTSHLPLPPLLG
jgi:hypothetical protein